MLNVQLSTRLCPSHSISMLEIVAQKPQNRIALQANQLKVGTLKSLQKSIGHYMGLLCFARCAPNQLQMQTFVVFSALMKGMGVYLLSVGPNEAEYAARFIRNECGEVNYVFELRCFTVKRNSHALIIRYYCDCRAGMLASEKR